MSVRVKESEKGSVRVGVEGVSRGKERSSRSKGRKERSKKEVKVRR